MESLGEDSLANVLSFLDLRSALTLTRVSKPWRRRLLSQHDEQEEALVVAATTAASSGSSSTTTGAMPVVWKEFFRRLAFSSQDWSTHTQQQEQQAICAAGAIQNVLTTCQHRRILQKTLFGQPPPARRHKTRPSNHCFHLPNRLFSFLPIIPDDDNDLEDDDEHGPWWYDDPPPVHFICDSFLLTSTAVGSQLLLLNPFTHSLTLYKSVLDNAVHSDEGMMEQAMRQAGTWIVTAQQQQQQVVPHSFHHHHRHDHHDHEVELAATAIADTVHRNHCLHQSDLRTPPQETLISVQDTILDVHLMAYFYEHAAQQQQRRRSMMLLDDDDGVEIEIEYVGIEAKPVLDPVHHHVPTGVHMVAVGRVLSNDFEPEGVVGFHHQQQQQQQPLECLEVMAWFRHDDNSNEETCLNDNKWVCRVQGEYHSLAVCASQRWVYVNPSYRRHDRPFHHRNDDHDVDDADENNDGHAHHRHRHDAGTHQVLAYPLVPYRRSPETPSESSSQQPPPDPSKFFPEPALILNCQDRVTTLGLCATGTRVVVSTLARTIHVWNTAAPSNTHGHAARLEQTISIPATMEQAFFSSDAGRDATTDAAAESSQQQQRRRLLSPVSTRVAETTPVRSIFCPRIQPVETCGFCTLHCSPEGNTVLLWHKTTGTNNTATAQTNPKHTGWCLHTMINLPLSAQRVPQLHYDGNRLVVFGQDHIGFIILVYQVSITLEQLAATSQPATETKGTTAADTAKEDETLSSSSVRCSTATTTSNIMGQEDSGGVFHATNTRRVRFANRIRHAALGGMETYESLHMTCNERFIVVNTKTGSLLSGGTTPFQEGLLVIDLEQDYQRHC